MLGTLYETGRGVAVNMSEAMKWYRKAAEHGFPRAQNNMGVTYANGDGVQQDLDEAIRWFMLAADQGNAEAFGNLAALDAGAHHLRPDYREAYFWSLVADHKAATNTAEFPEELVKALRGRLSAEEAGRVERQAQEWIEKHSFRPESLRLWNGVEVGKVLAALGNTAHASGKAQGYVEGVGGSL